VVQARCGRLADLQFLDKDRAPRFPGSSEYVVLMKKFTGHNWYDAAQRHFPTERLYHANGGIGSV
jgi:hypothetical protein